MFLVYKRKIQRSQLVGEIGNENVNKYNITAENAIKIYIIKKEVQRMKVQGIKKRHS